VRQEAGRDEAIQRLQTIPSVGPISALTWVAAVDGIKRFTRAKQLTSYCGIVPTVRASADRQEQGRSPARDAAKYEPCGSKQRIRWCAVGSQKESFRS
jgi:transposase